MHNDMKTYNNVLDYTNINQHQAITNNGLVCHQKKKKWRGRTFYFFKTKKSSTLDHALLYKSTCQMLLEEVTYLELRTKLYTANRQSCLLPAASFLGNTIV